MSRNNGKAQAKATPTVRSAYTHHRRIISLRASKGSHTKNATAPIDASLARDAAAGLENPCRIKAARLKAPPESSMNLMLKYQVSDCAGKREKTKQTGAEGKLHNGSSSKSNISKNF